MARESSGNSKNPAPATDYLKEAKQFLNQVWLFISSVYYAGEDRYYGFLDQLDAKGIPVYNIIDPIDRIFPSFLICILLFFLLIVLLFVLIFSTPVYPFTVQVVDASGNALEGASVELMAPFLSNPLTKESTLDGVVFEVGGVGEGTINVSKNDFKPRTITTLLEPGSEALKVVLSPAQIAILTRSVLIRDDSSKKPLFDIAQNKEQTGKIYLFCSETVKNIGSRAVSTSNVSLDSTAFANCDPSHVMVYVEFPGYEKSTSVSLKSDLTVISLKKLKPQTVSLTVRVNDANNKAALPSMQVIVTGSTQYPSKTTDSSGTAKFDLAPATFKLQVVDSEGFYLSSTAEELDLSDGRAVDKTIYLTKAPPSAQKKVAIRILDANSNQPVSAFVSLYLNGILLNSDQAKSGLYTYPIADLNQSTNYYAVISDPNYVLRIVSNVSLFPRNENSVQVVTIEPVRLDSNGQPTNAFALKTRTLSELYRPITAATVNLFDTRYTFPLDSAPSGSEGLHTFYNLPIASYYATAFVADANGRSTDVNAILGQTKDVNIILVTGRATIKVNVLNGLTGQAIPDAQVRFLTSLDENALELVSNLQGMAQASFKVDRVVTVQVKKDSFESVQLAPLDLRLSRETSTYTLTAVIFPASGSDAGLGSRLMGVFSSPRYNANSSVSSLRKGQSYWFLFRTKSVPEASDVFMQATVGKLDQNVSQGFVTISDDLSSAQIVSYHAEFNSVNSFDQQAALTQPPAKRVVSLHDTLEAQMATEWWVKVDISNAESVASDENVDLYFGSKSITPNQSTPLYHFTFQLGKPICLFASLSCPRFVIMPKFVNQTTSRELSMNNGYFELIKDYNYDFSFQVYNATNQSFSNFSIDIHQSSPTSIILDDNSFSISERPFQAGETLQSPDFKAWALTDSQDASWKIQVGLVGADTNQIVPLKVVPKGLFAFEHSRLFTSQDGVAQPFYIQVRDRLTRAFVNRAFVELSVDESFATAEQSYTDVNGSTALNISVGAAQTVYLRLSAPGFETLEQVINLDSQLNLSEAGQWSCLIFENESGNPVQSVEAIKDGSVKFKLRSTCESSVDVSLMIQTSSTNDYWPTLIDQSTTDSAGTTGCTNSSCSPQGAQLPSKVMTPGSVRSYSIIGDQLKGVYGIYVKAKELNSTNPFTTGSRLLFFVYEKDDDCFALDSNGVFDFRSTSSNSSRVFNRCPFGIQSEIVPHFSIDPEVVFVSRDRNGLSIPQNENPRSLGFTLGDNGLAGEVYGRLKVRDYTPKTPRLDLVFLLDASGSMSHLDSTNNYDQAMENLCIHIDQTLERLRSQGLIISPSIYAMGRSVSCASSLAIWGDETIPYSYGPFNDFEAWGPASQYVIKNHPWVDGSAQAIVIFSDNSPGGRHNSFATCDGVNDSNCFWPKEDVETIIANTITLAQAEGTAIIFSKIHPFEGLNATLKTQFGDPTKLDALEAMEEVATRTGGRVLNHPTSPSEWDAFSWELLGSLYLPTQESFHVLLEGGPPTCYGPGGVIGRSGPSAVPKISWDWEWTQLDEDSCSPVLTNGNKNPKPAYCDSTQFSISLLQRLKKMDALIKDKNLADVYARQSFYAYLKTDGFSDDFRADLDQEIVTNQSLDASNWYTNNVNGFRSIFTNPDLFRLAVVNSLADRYPHHENYNLTKPGIYKVDVSYSLRTPDYSFFNGSQNNLNYIQVYLTHMEDPVENNPLYYLPLNGKVGLVENASRFDRTGYGVSFEAGHGLLSILNQTGRPYALQASPGSALISNIDVQSDQSILSVNGANRGVVFSVEYDPALGRVNKIRFEPSYPAPALVRVESVNGLGSKFLYTLQERGNSAPLVIPENYRFMTEWTQVASTYRSSTNQSICLNMSGQSAAVNVADVKAAADDSCATSSNPTSSSFGLSFTNAQNGVAYYRALFYRPPSTILELKQTCSTPNSRAVFTNAQNNSTSPQSSLINLSGLFDVTLQQTFSFNDWKSVFDMADQNFTVTNSDGSTVSGYPLCVYHDEKELMFFWNPSFALAVSSSNEEGSIALPEDAQNNRCMVPVYTR